MPFLHRRSISVVHLVLALGFSSHGCIGPGESEPIADLAEPVTVENSRPVWVVGEEWSVDSIPQLTVPTGPDTYLYQVSGAVELSDGSIAVADAGRDEILLFGPDGSLNKVFGGKGEGPAEFISLSRLSVEPGDTLVAWESNAVRRKRFSRDGEVVSVEPGPFDQAPRGIEAWVETATIAAIVKLTDEGSPVPPSGVFRPTRFIVRVGSNGNFDTLSVLPGPEMKFLDVGGPMKIPSTTLFFPDTELAGGGDPWRLVMGDGSEASFEVRDQSGSLRSVVSWDSGPQDLTREDVARALLERIQRDIGRGRDRAEAQRRLDQLPRPTRSPVFRSLFVDDLSNTWVERYPRVGVPEGTWTVFDPKGVWLGQVKIPRATRPLQIGENFLIGLRTDSLDVQTVARFHLVR